MANYWVQATSASLGGPLQILRQFLEHIPLQHPCHTYFVAVDPSLELPSLHNVTYIRISTKNKAKRIWWDRFGTQQWIRKNKVSIDGVISFQNTGCYLKNTAQILYFHQLLAVEARPWSLLRSDERTLFFYRHFFAFFIRLYLPHIDSVVVQTEYCKSLFEKKFRYKAENIQVVFPAISDLNMLPNSSISFPENEFHFIYPASAYAYKNHAILVEAMILLRNKKPELAQQIRIHFTLEEKENKYLHQQISKQHLGKLFVFEGCIHHAQLLSYYPACRALLFPSTFESFGLPLIEAAHFGTAVIASDTESSREILSNYSGCTFLHPNEAISWAHALEKSCLHNDRHSSFTAKEEDQWALFFHHCEKIFSKKSSETLAKSTISRN